MRPLSRGVAVAIVAAIALQAAPSTAAAACSGLTDDDSKFAVFLKDTIGVDDGLLQDLITVFEPLHSVAPWLSTCVASIDPMAIFSTAQMSSGYKTCNATISAFEMPEELTDKAVRKTICPFYGEKLMPCINNVAVQAIVDAMAGAGRCCDDLKAQIKQSFGTELKTMVADLLNKFGAAMCTVKTFTDATKSTQSEACVSSMYTSFMTSETMEYLPVLMQMPTDQVCKAVMGQSFQTTLKNATRFDWAAQGTHNFGICYEPLSELFKLIGAYPLMATPMVLNEGGLSMAMSDAFVPGKCLSPDSVFKWVQGKDSWPMQWARMADDLLATFGYNLEDMIWSWFSPGSREDAGSLSSWGSSSSSNSWDSSSSWDSAGDPSSWGSSSDSTAEGSWNSPGSDGMASSWGPDGSDGSSASWSSWGSWGSWGSDESMGSQDPTQRQNLNVTTLLEMFMGGIESSVPPMCVHLASGQTCDYGGATIAMGYKTSTSESAPTPTPEVTPTPTKAATTTAQSSAMSVWLGVAFATTSAASLSSF